MNAVERNVKFSLIVRLRLYRLRARKSKHHVCLVSHGRTSTPIHPVIVIFVNTEQPVFYSWRSSFCTNHINSSLHSLKIWPLLQQEGKWNELFLIPGNDPLPAGSLAAGCSPSLLLQWIALPMLVIYRDELYISYVALISEQSGL